MRASHRLSSACSGEEAWICGSEKMEYRLLEPVFNTADALFAHYGSFALRVIAKVDRAQCLWLLLKHANRHQASHKCL